MLKLDLKKEPYWIDLQADARVKVKPLTSALMHMAQAEAIQKLLMLKAERKARLEAGHDASDLPDLDNESIRHSVSETALISALAVHAVIAWENIMTPGGTEPAEATPENIRELMEFWFVNQEFGRAYMRQIELLEIEGNGSRPAVNGTSAAGRAIAVPAKRKTSPAPKANQAC